MGNILDTSIFEEQQAEQEDKEFREASEASPTKLWEQGKISDEEFWNSDDMIPLSEAIESGLLDKVIEEDEELLAEEIGHSMVAEALHA